MIKFCRKSATYDGHNVVKVFLCSFVRVVDSSRKIDTNKLDDLNRATYLLIIQIFPPVVMAPYVHEIMHIAQKIGLYRSWSYLS